MRYDCLNKSMSFTFETVLSTDRNLKLLQTAKEKGYFIRCIYVLTSNVDVNILRVQARFEDGGHNVPISKIKSRYVKALNLLPELIQVCDVVHIYDNTTIPTRIFKKRKNKVFFFENTDWSINKIEKLTNISCENFIAP